MIQAAIHGKLSERLEKSEDVLTSSVLGMFKYITDHQIILSILNNAINAKYNKMVLNNIEPDNIEYIFWPAFPNSEPDLVIIIKECPRTIVVCLEAKYLSGKSSHEVGDTLDPKKPNSFRDQLAREFEDINSKHVLGRLELRKDDPHLEVYLIYLTLDAALPRNDIYKSKEVIEKRNNIPRIGNKLYWLSWRAFYSELKKWRPKSEIDEKIRVDLLKLLVYRNIKRFDGFEVNRVMQVPWSYNRKDISWEIEPVDSINYIYKKRCIYDRGSNS